MNLNKMIWMRKHPCVVYWLQEEFHDYQQTELLHQKSVKELAYYSFKEIRPDLYDGETVLSKKLAS